MPGAASWCSPSSATRRPAGGGARNTCSRTSRRRWATRCSAPTRLAQRVVRIGEKGNVWVELEATGVANHAAHVHLGRNAVDALVGALGAVRALAALAPSLPAAVERTIAQAKAVSEAASGAGEAETLRRITVNTGRIEGGIGVNTIPDRARALCDIRIPPGVTVDRIRAELVSAIDPLPDVLWRILECTEPSWTNPEEEIVRAV